MLKALFCCVFFLLVFNFVEITANFTLIENKGQLINSEGKANSEVKYYNDRISPAFYLSDRRISFVLQRTKRETFLFSDIKFGADEKLNIARPELYRFDLFFENQNRKSELLAEEVQKGIFNFYLPHNPEGICDVNDYKNVIYKDLYPNTDFCVSVKNNNFHSELHLYDISSIISVKLRFEGVERIESINKNTVRIKIEDQDLVFKLPEFYIIDEMQNKRLVEFAYNIKNETISFSEKSTQKEYALELAPLDWSTYAGGLREDKIISAQFDNFGNIMATGFTYSYNFPTTSGVWKEQWSEPVDILIMKFSNSGEIIWSTFYGSYGLEFGYSIKADKDNNYWIVGECRDNLFPVTDDAFQKTYKGGTADGAIIKLDDKGKRIYATYYGGSNYDTFSSLAFDSKNNLWLASRTNSRVFPCTPDAIKSNLDGEYDGVIIQMSNDGKQLYSTYFGGKYDDFYESLAVDSEDNIILSGYSSSPNYFTTSDAYQKTLKEYFDAVLTKISKDKKVIWSTFFGGSGYDYGSNIAIDRENNLYIHGYTSSMDLPTSPEVYQSKIGGGSDCFLARFDINGQFQWVTYIGGSNYESEIATIYTQFGNVACSNTGKIGIAAKTLSNDLKTTPGAFQKSSQGMADAFFGIFNPDGTASTISYLGGSKSDHAFDIDFYQDSNLVICGVTESIDFPLKNSFQLTYGGGIDGFIVKFGNKSDCPYLAFDYKDFKNIKQLNFSGFAHQNDNYIRLTKKRVNESGAVWFNQKLPLQFGFTTDFAFRFSEGSNNNCNDNSEEGADGIALVIQNSNPYAIGWSGGGLGYDGIKNSIAIEFDTFSNDSTQLENLFDPNGNHIAVQCNGINDNTSKHLKEINLAMNSNIPVISSDGKTYYISISYNPREKTLIVYFDSTKYFKSPAIVLKDFDLSKLISLYNSSLAWIGITGATGCAFQNQDVLSWNLCLDQPFTTDVEEKFEDTDDLFFISPNPAENRLIIKSKIGFNEKIDLRLVDVLGFTHYLTNNELIEFIDNSIKIDLKDIPSGSYILLINQKNNFYSKKIIVTK